MSSNVVVTQPAVSRSTCLQLMEEKLSFQPPGNGDLFFFHTCSRRRQKRRREGVVLWIRVACASGLK